MKVCCVSSLESPHWGDSNEFTQYTVFNINKKITLNYPKSAAKGSFSKGRKHEFETAMVNEPSVYEPLKFYCYLDDCGYSRCRRLLFRHFLSFTKGLLFLPVSETRHDIYWNRTVWKSSQIQTTNQNQGTNTCRLGFINDMTINCINEN